MWLVVSNLRRSLRPYLVSALIVSNKSHNFDLRYLKHCNALCFHKHSDILLIQLCEMKCLQTCRYTVQSPEREVSYAELCYSSRLHTSFAANLPCFSTYCSIALFSFLTHLLHPTNLKIKLKVEQPLSLRDHCNSVIHQCSDPLAIVVERFRFFVFSLLLPSLFCSSPRHQGDCSTHLKNHRSRAYVFQKCWCALSPRTQLRFQGASVVCCWTLKTQGR